MATILEGGIRKWIVATDTSNLSHLVYFSKDLLFGLIVLVPAHNRLTSELLALRNWLLLGVGTFLAGCVISAAHGANPVGAALTLRAGVLLPVLAFILLLRFRRFRLLPVLWVAGTLTMANCILAVVQNRLPADHVLNRYAADTLNIVALDSGVRATGTFSYITGLGVLSSVGVWAGLVMLSLRTRKWEQTAAFLFIIAGFGCALASVSRAPLATAVFMIGAWLLWPRSGIAILPKTGAVACGVLALSMALGLTPIFSQMVEAVKQRHDANEDTFSQRAFGQVDECVTVLHQAPLGSGLGNEQVGGNFYAGGERSFGTFEYQFPRIVLEAGFLGLVGYLIICIGAVVCLERAKRRAKTIAVTSAITATQIFLAPMYYTNVVFNHTASAFVWIIFVAVMAALNTQIPSSFFDVRKHSRPAFRRSRASA